MTTEVACLLGAFLQFTETLLYSLELDLSTLEVARIG
jgi:hypothetical protein